MGRHVFVQGRPFWCAICPNIGNNIHSFNIRKQGRFENLQSFIGFSHRVDGATAVTTKMAFEITATVCNLLENFCSTFCDFAFAVWLNYVVRRSASRSLLTACAVASYDFTRCFIEFYFDRTAKTVTRC